MKCDLQSQILKTKLQVELADRRSLPPDVIVLDGCAILWIVRWPAHGLVKDLFAECISLWHKTTEYLTGTMIKA